MTVGQISEADFVQCYLRKQWLEADDRSYSRAIAFSLKTIEFNLLKNTDPYKFIDNYLQLSWDSFFLSAVRLQLLIQRKMF